jgi:AraC-like DNA-binding protein/quercetin dioxygenase-like cupin family protein
MEQQVAVTAGATRVQRLDIALGRVSALRFPPNLTLTPHDHPQATVAVVLAGGFVGVYRGNERECRTRSLIVEPAGERHANNFGGTETTVLALSLEPDGLGRSLETAAGRFSIDRDPFTEMVARHAIDELDRPDDVTPMAVEAAALEIVTRVTRLARQERRPAWLEQAQAFLHDRYTEPLTLTHVAQAVDVQPERVARAFRRAFGDSVAGYLRRIRVDAAAALVAGTDLPISRIAADVGFADQSHLTRCFGRYLGTTPGRYRADRAGGAGRARLP